MTPPASARAQLRRHRTVEGPVGGKRDAVVVARRLARNQPVEDIASKRLFEKRSERQRAVLTLVKTE